MDEQEAKKAIFDTVKSVSLFRIGKSIGCEEWRNELCVSIANLTNMELEQRGFFRDLQRYRCDKCRSYIENNGVWGTCNVFRIRRHEDDSPIRYCFDPADVHIRLCAVSKGENNG